MNEQDDDFPKPSLYPSLSPLKGNKYKVPPPPTIARPPVAIHRANQRARHKSHDVASMDTTNHINC